MVFGRVLFCFLAICMTSRHVAAELVKVEMNMTTGKKAVDMLGEFKLVLVNGAFPGPAIRVKQGDILEVTIRNQLTREINSTGYDLSMTAIHFHGLNQYGTPWYDGVPAVSQCPMKSGTTSVVRFEVKDVGTHWYHPHHLLQRSGGGYGSLVVEPTTETLEYDNEETLVISDIWNLTEYQMTHGLDQVGRMTWPGDGHTMLINGHSHYDLTVEKGKTYRLRLINACTLHYLTLRVAGHNLTVVEADGTPLQPVSLPSIEMSPGQRYSVLLTANQDAKVYKLVVNDQYRGPARMENDYLTFPSLPALMGKINYAHSNVNDVVNLQLNSTAYDMEAGWELRTLKSKKTISLPNSTKEFIFNISQEWVEPNGKVGGGQTATASIRWLFNGRTLREPETPYLLQSFYNLTDDTPSHSSRTISLSKSDVVDVVFQNQVSLNGVCEQHPMHIHGHKFYVIEQGTGTYKDPTSVTESSFVSPVVRDTVTVFPRSHATLRGSALVAGVPKAGCGWLKVRFVADNPGSWFMHCHTDFHTVMGMALVFEESLDTLWQSASLPPNHHVCGTASQKPTPASSKPAASAADDTGILNTGSALTISIFVVINLLCPF